MKPWIVIQLGALVALTTMQSSAVVLFVDAGSSNPVAPFSFWSTAATNIQDAVDAASPGDQIIVTNGIYQTGGRVIYGALTNRIAINKAVAVQRVNGPAVTTIKGNPVLGNTAVRCAYLTNGALLTGFTLARGATRTTGDQTNEQSGGGIWCETSGVISNCVVIDNGVNGNKGAGIYGGIVWNSVIARNTNAFNGAGVAAALVFNCLITNNSPRLSGSACGGGAYSCILSNCQIFSNGGDGDGAGACNCTVINSTITNNSCWYTGGGVYNSKLTNCMIYGNNAGAGGGSGAGTLVNCWLIGNHAAYGGGSSGGTLINCLIISNSANNDGGGSDQSFLKNCSISKNVVTNYSGGGVHWCTLTNCIVFNNFAPTDPNYYSGTLNFCCTTPLPATGIGNFTNSPAFVNPLNDFHLQSTSPCINAGNNRCTASATDFDGNPRIAGGTVDVGAYEFQHPGSQISYAWLQQFGWPTDGSVDLVDTDGDGASNWTEWQTGTDPINPFSVLKMLTITTTNNPVGKVITWQSATNVTYYLQRSSDLSGQPGFVTISSNLAGIASFTDTNATASTPYFYRVGVQ